jgi:hypothetical protein
MRGPFRLAAPTNHILSSFSLSPDMLLAGLLATPIALQPHRHGKESPIRGPEIGSLFGPAQGFLFLIREAYLSIFLSNG